MATALSVGALPPSRVGSRSLAPWQSYLFAIVMTAATLAARLLLGNVFGERAALVLFAVPIMLSAYLGGLGGGLVATALSFLGAGYFLLPPMQSFGVASAGDRLQLLCLALAGVVISVLNEALHVARRRADVATHQNLTVERALHESEGRYRAIVDWSPDAIAVHRRGTLIFANPAAVQMFGAKAPAELMGKSILDLIDPSYHDIARARMNASRDHGWSAPLIEMGGVKLDGTPMPMTVQSIPIVYDGEPAILASLCDTSWSKAHEIEIERLNRLYSALSHVNQAIVRMPSRDDLCLSVCRILVEHGGVRMAWIGCADGTSNVLVPIASWGDDGGYLERIQVYCNDDEAEGRGPSGVAFREGRPYVCLDMLEDEATRPWRDEIARVGFRACAALPIALRGRVWGVLNVYALELGFFKEKEIDLLTETADDIAFALDNADREADRHRADLAAQESVRVERDRAEQYLNTAEVILLALNIEGRITMVNRFACSVFGWTAEELAGRDFIETMVPARIRDETRRKLATVLTGPDSSVVENVIVTKSGDERMIEWRNTLRRDPEGRVVATLSSGADLTERHESLAALRTTEERMRFALQNANVGTWDVDYATGILEWSTISEAQYGLAPGTFPGTFEAFVERIHPDDRTAITKKIAESIKAGTDFSLLHRTIWPDGTVHWLSGAGRILLDAEGQPVRGIGISQDVTERHALEERFHQAQKMDAIGRLAGGVAHDFNNLLTVILGYTQMLLADLPPSDPRQADLTEIMRAGTTAAGLTRQLLAFSRKQIVEPTLLELNEIVGNMEAMLGRLIGEDVTIVLRLAREVALVRADRAQVEQVVMNLAVNARDAMPTGGTLTIETANVSLDEPFAKMHPSLTAGPYVVLTVSDTGTGMTDEVQARLFEPFFTTKAVGRGTGIGLATVHGIVTRFGGSISVYSELGVGTSCKVYFPRADDNAEAPAEVPALALATHTHSILVVEDADGVRELARKMLDRQGFTVFVAADADQAFRIVEEHASIDLLLTDVVMPGMSGTELSRRLVERRPALKVLFMSGYTDDAIVHHGVLNPGVALLHKPFTAEALARKIHEVLDG